MLVMKHASQKFVLSRSFKNVLHIGRSFWVGQPRSTRQAGERSTGWLRGAGQSHQAFRLSFCVGADLSGPQRHVQSFHSGMPAAHSTHTAADSKHKRYVGVHPCISKKWQARIFIGRHGHSLGYYHCMIDAAKAYDEACIWKGKLPVNYPGKCYDEARIRAHATLEEFVSQIRLKARSMTSSKQASMFTGITQTRKKNNMCTIRATVYVTSLGQKVCVGSHETQEAAAHMVDQGRVLLGVAPINFINEKYDAVEISSFASQAWHPLHQLYLKMPLHRRNKLSLQQSPASAEGTTGLLTTAEPKTTSKGLPQILKARMISRQAYLAAANRPTKAKKREIEVCVKAGIHDIFVYLFGRIK